METKAKPSPHSPAHGPTEANVRFLSSGARTHMDVPLRLTFRTLHVRARISTAMQPQQVSAVPVELYRHNGPADAEQRQQQQHHWDRAESPSDKAKRTSLGMPPFRNLASITNSISI